MKHLFECRSVFSIIIMEQSLQMLHGYMTLFLGLGSNDALHVGVRL